MNVTEAINQRHSCRAFTSQKVDMNIIKTLLNTAKRAPSGVNMQPWEVVVSTGKAKANLCTKMTNAFRSGNTEEMDYHYYPTKWIEPFKTRRVATGKQLYATLDIKREDKEKRLKQWEANYSAFDAPVMLLFFIDNSLETGSYMDYGMFLQNIMLLAEEAGLASCPQGALAEFPNLIKQELSIDREKILLGGMALGYRDEVHIVNQYKTPRAELDEFCQFVD